MLIRFDDVISAQSWLAFHAAGDCSVLTRQNRWVWAGGPELLWVCVVPGAGPESRVPFVLPMEPVVVITEPRYKQPKRYRGAYARRVAGNALTGTGRAA
jgi:hypothetical protein